MSFCLPFIFFLKSSLTGICLAEALVVYLKHNFNANWTEPLINKNFRVGWGVCIVMVEKLCRLMVTAWLETDATIVNTASTVTGGWSVRNVRCEQTLINWSFCPRISNIQQFLFPLGILVCCVSVVIEHDYRAEFSEIDKYFRGLW